MPFKYKHIDLALAQLTGVLKSTLNRFHFSTTCK